MRRRSIFGPWPVAPGLLAALGAVACSRGAAPGRDALEAALTEGALTAQQARGKTLFATRCATCHGAEGRGDGQNASRLTPPPPDMTTSLRLVPVPDRRRIVALGSAAAGRSPLCPPRGETLRPEEVEALLAWLDVVAKLPAPAAPSAPSRWRRRTAS